MIKQPAAVAGLRLISLMESSAPPSPPPKDYVHYHHTDACSFSRWTARESYQFMYAKPWQKVTDFYLDVVNCRRSLSELFGKELALSRLNKRLSGLAPTEVQRAVEANTLEMHEVHVQECITSNACLVLGGVTEFDVNLENRKQGIEKDAGPGINYPCFVIWMCGFLYVDVLIEAGMGRKTSWKTGRWARVTFKILLSYHGSSFDGWQKQPGLNTVQGLIERSLGKFVDEKKVQLLKEKKLPIDGCAVVAGRTDKGVTALEQVCSFYTWRKDVTALEIEDAINGAAPGKIRVISVSPVSREFHPNFSAKWRRYLYIFPFNYENMDDKEGQCKKNVLDVSVRREGQYGGCFHEENFGHVTDGDDQDESQTRNKPLTFEISRVNHLLHQLEGKLLSFRMFARDTKGLKKHIQQTTMQFGFLKCHQMPNGISRLQSALFFTPINEDDFVVHQQSAFSSMHELQRPIYPVLRILLGHMTLGKDGTRAKTMCIELVANRFLRKMVRVLVATAIREAAAGADDDALLKLMDATCRRATAPPAPPDGLCLVDVGYTEFNRKNCLIP
ncbi:tRNA pseudouridine synthase A [Sesamum angolense]|uniref:tRNA pseudouridine synthase A n=1 Tax=Sesamum angolense TaxID=2727404 RepID=A0AAE1WNK1_9LAMI|nr:tRNA pseudouridine synthase A [Sesamum angolense]